MDVKTVEAEVAKEVPVIVATSKGKLLPLVKRGWAFGVRQVAAHPALALVALIALALFAIR